VIAATVFLAGVVFAAIGLIGTVYLAISIATIFMLKRRSVSAASPAPPVSVLVPLRGAEAGLDERLAALLAQDYGGEAQLVCAVADPDDRAAAVAEALKARCPERRVALVVDGRTYGPNRKISNLINALQAAEHDTLVMLDSDILVDRGYLARVVEALQQPNVGAVTHLYHGLSGEGPWAAVSALSINSHFVPSVILALRFRAADPCFGSTIALSRAFLDELGGLSPFAAVLQDDYAIGMAVRSAGREVAILSETVGHVCTESSAAAAFDTQLRAAQTVRAVTPAGYAGSIVTQPFVPALVGAILLHNAAGVAVLMVVAALRAAQTYAVQRVLALPPQRYFLLPLRDLVAFAAFVAAFFTRDIVWRGEHYRLAAGGGLRRAEARTPAATPVLDEGSPR